MSHTTQTHRRYRYSEVRRRLQIDETSFQIDESLSHARQLGAKVERWLGPEKRAEFSSRIAQHAAHGYAASAGNEAASDVNQVVARSGETSQRHEALGKDREASWQTLAPTGEPPPSEPQAKFLRVAGEGGVGNVLTVKGTETVPSEGLTEESPDTPLERERRVADFLAKRRDDPTGVTVRALAKATGLSRATAARSVAWRGFQTWRKSMRPGQARAIQLTEQMLAVISDRASRDPADIAAERELDHDAELARLIEEQVLDEQSDRR